MAAKVDAESPLIHSTLTQIEEVVFWTRSEPPQIPADRTDRIYMVREHDRLDLLAQTFYGSPRARWIIALANDIRIEPIDLIPGENIRLPSRDRLRGLGVVLR